MFSKFYSKYVFITFANHYIQIWHSIQAFGIRSLWCLQLLCIVNSFTPKFHPSLIFSDMCNLEPYKLSLVLSLFCTWFLLLLGFPSMTMWEQRGLRTEQNHTIYMYIDLVASVKGFRAVLCASQSCVFISFNKAKKIYQFLFNSVLFIQQGALYC